MAAAVGGRRGCTGGASARRSNSHPVAQQAVYNISATWPESVNSYVTRRSDRRCRHRLAAEFKEQAMKTRALGRQGLKVSELGLGCMGLSDFYSSSGVTEAQGISLIQRALSLGVTFLDTADVYGPHTNEVTVGKALQGRRDSVVLATKFGIVREPGTTTRGVNGSPDYVRAACEASLKRLGVDVIDLYYQHRVDPKVPIEETVGAMARLVAQGKVRYLGLSEAAPATVRRAHKIHPIAAVQNEYSLLYRNDGEETLAATRELGISLVAYAPLGRSM